MLHSLLAVSRGGLATHPASSPKRPILLAGAEAAVHSQRGLYPGTDYNEQQQRLGEPYVTGQTQAVGRRPL